MNIKNTTNIFVDCHVFDSGFQGTRTYIQGLYTALMQYEDLHFFLGSNNPKSLQTIFGNHPNVTYVQYHFQNKYLRLLIDIPNIIKKNKIDFAHFQYTVSPIKRCKYIVTTHDVLFIDFPKYFSFFSRFINTILYQQSAKWADIRLTVSEYSKQKLQQHFGLSDYVVTPNAVDGAFFETYTKEQVKVRVANEFSLNDYIIYVSRWEPRKNHQMVLKAFVELELYKKHQLLFLGNESIFNPEYQEIFDGLTPEIKNKITTINNTDFQTMLLLLRGANASVYPSFAEGFGIPPLESVAAKIPTICSDKTAMSDFIFFREFYFDPSKQKEFNQKLLYILENNTTTEFEKMAHSIKEIYNWEHTATVVYELLKQHTNQSRFY
jgi:glycosyltransferase involved in cell wall biosynthesis